MKPKVAVLYHFYYPDDVVSARHFQDLSEDLAQLDWEVEVWPSNRSCRNLGMRYSAQETYRGVHVRRLWRPAFSQGTALGRIFNSLWMILGWCLRWAFYGANRPQVVLIGTDPVLALFAAIGIRIFDSKVKIAHWCFDLYPEAAAADGRINKNGLLYQFFGACMRKAYGACDLIVDLGACMRHQLNSYASSAQRETLIPWAFYEPTQILLPDPKERINLFGDATLGLLYSGNFGLAHTANLILKLAETLAPYKARVCFSVRGHGEKALREKCSISKSPVSFAAFAAEDQLQRRLQSADIHLVSLKAEWTGMVVPSKFFGSLAAGKPVLFEGSQESAVAQWIQKYQLGWVLTEDSFETVQSELIKITKTPSQLIEMQAHCRETYQKHFSRHVITSRWDKILRKLT